MRRLNETEVRAAVRGSLSRDGDITRPPEEDPAGIKCLGCNKMEFRAREFCRCGYYLRGQLENERSQELTIYLATLRRRLRQGHRLRGAAVAVILLAVGVCALYLTHNLQWLGASIPRYVFLISILSMFGSLKIIGIVERTMSDLVEEIDQLSQEI